MNAPKAILALSVLLAVSLTSCNSMRRFGKDLYVTVASPLVSVYGGATDGYTAAKGVRDGLDGGIGSEVLAMPFTFVYHTAKHVVYAAIHAVDAVLLPAYGLAELHPYGPEVKPLDYYKGTIFDDDGTTSGTDAESGESLPPGYDR